MTRDRIPRLYHFCDSRNVDSIKEWGAIYSLANCEALGITIAVAGGDGESQATDRAKGFDKYVHLGFLPNHPMEFRARESGRIQSSVFLQISREILAQPGVLFVPGMANTIGIPTYPIDEAFEAGLVDFQALYSWLDWSDSTFQERRQAVEKYEILVPEAVPISMILNLQ